MQEAVSDGHKPFSITGAQLAGDLFAAPVFTGPQDRSRLPGSYRRPPDYPTYDPDTGEQKPLQGSL